MGGKPVVNVGEVGNQLIRTGTVISAVQNAARGASAAGKLNRFVRAADIGWQLYEWFINRPHSPVQQGYPPPQGGTWICGDSSGPNVLRYSYVPPGFGFCGLNGQSLNETSNKAKYSWLYGRQYTVAGGQKRWDVKGIYSIASGGNGVYPAYGVPGPAFVPLVARPLPFNLASAASSTYPRPSLRPRPLPRPKPGLKDKPPGPRTKERKGQVETAMGKAVQAAFAASEGADAVDAIWDALPDEVKKRTAKSGVARKGAMIGQGTRYATTIDKFMAIYRNIGRLSLSKAAKNLLINHIVDKIIGTMSAKGADKLRKQLGASGWGNII